MANKRLIWNIMAGSLYVIILVVFIFLINIYNWSWIILLWLVIIPVLGLSTHWLVMKFKKPLKKQELGEEGKEKHLDIVSQQTFVREFIRENDDLADEVEDIQIKPYTPRQEGTDKLTVDVATCQRYWNGDRLLLALSREEFKVVAYKEYQKSDPEAEKKFEQEIDKAVLNPQRTIEVEEPQIDPHTLQTKIVKKRLPLDYIIEQKEKREAKEAEKEEGAEE